MVKPQQPADSSRHNPLQPVIEYIQGGGPDEICSRYGISRQTLEQRLKTYHSSLRQLALADGLIPKKVGRNEACPCGSGKKFKKCCLPKHDEVRSHMPSDQLKEIEERAKLKENLDKEVKKGFEFLFAEDFGKAQKFASTLLEIYPEDDRLHDIVVVTSLAYGDYDGAFYSCRSRWQVATEEKDFFLKNGHFKREGIDRKTLVHFYAPSTWLEKLWISNRARTYRDLFPKEEDLRLEKMVERLKAANDLKRFPGRQEEGYEARRRTLEPVIKDIEMEGAGAIPFLLPLTYNFSWASLFVPDLLGAFGTEASVQLLAELSMFRFPYFAQQCLSSLERLGESTIPHIQQVLEANPAFDELKVGLITVLGNITTPDSFAILTRLVDHENPYVVNWVAQALGKHNNQEALPFLEKARSRLQGLNKIAGAIRDLVANKND